MSIDALRQAVLITRCPVWVDGDDKHHEKRWDNEFPFDPELEDAVWGKKLFFFEFDHLIDGSLLPSDGFLDARTLTAICRLRANVNSIIADYVAFTKSISDVHGPEPAMYSPDWSGSRKLSNNELGRLQRTFLRYELYCRVWGWPYFYAWLERLRDVSMNEFHFKGSGTDPWAREGLVAVHRYVIAKYTATFQEIHQDFTTAVHAISESNGRVLTGSYPLPCAKC